jgi:hypothetical protein
VCDGLLAADSTVPRIIADFPTGCPRRKGVAPRLESSSLLFRNRLTVGCETAVIGKRLPSQESAFEINRTADAAPFVPKQITIPPFDGNISFNAQHAPIGAFMSFTCGHFGHFGHFGSGGGIGVEIGRPANQNIYVGMKRGDRRSSAAIRCLPFVRGAGAGGSPVPAEEHYSVEHAPPAPQTSGVTCYAADQVRRHYGWATDAWVTPDFTFSVYTPFGAIGQPGVAEDSAVRASLLPAIVATLDVDNRVLGALEDSADGIVVEDAVQLLRETMQDPLIDTLRRHSLRLLLDPQRRNLFPDGGIKLSSTSNNSWMSKIAVFQHVARKVLKLHAGDHRIAELFDAADTAHVRWQTDGSGFWACSDQFVNGLAKGSRYYPRIITAALWLTEPAAAATPTPQVAINPAVATPRRAPTDTAKSV